MTAGSYTAVPDHRRDDLRTRGHLASSLRHHEPVAGQASSPQQRLVVLLLSDRIRHHAWPAEFILLGLFQPGGHGRAALSGVGTALTLSLTGAGVIWMTLRARRILIQRGFYRWPVGPGVLRPPPPRGCSAVSPTVIRRPSQSPPEAYGRTATPARAKAAAYASVREPPGSQRTNALSVRHLKAEIPQADGQGVARLDQIGDSDRAAATPPPAKRSPPPSGDDTPNGSDTARTAAATSIGHAVADAKPGKPARLGEGPQHHDIGSSDHRVQTVQSPRVSDELHTPRRE